MFGKDSLSMRGQLNLIRHRRGPGFWWHFRNRVRPSFWLGWLAVKLAYLFSRTTGIVTMVSELRMIKRTVDGTLIDYGAVCYRVITTVGVQAMSNDFSGLAGAEISNFKYHGWGGVLGTTAPAAPAPEAKTDTSLVANLVTAYVISSPAPTAGAEAGATGNWQYTAQVTATFPAATYINEHGLFNQTTVIGATLWDRSVYANTPMAQNESMTFQYILTIQSGG